MIVWLHTVELSEHWYGFSVVGSYSSGLEYLSKGMGVWLHVAKSCEQ